MTAMHDEQRAHSSVRISVGWANGDEQIEKAAQRIADAAEHRSVASVRKRRTGSAEGGYAGRPYSMWSSIVFTSSMPVTVSM
jgi:hypothetical protein